MTKLLSTRWDAPLRPLGIIGLVLLSAVAVPLLSGGAVAAGSHVAITNVSVSPEQPAPGQLTELEATIRNADSSAEAVDVTDLYIREKGSASDLTRIEDVGTVSVGSSLTIPLTTSFDEPGVKTLRMTLIGKTASGSAVRLQYPLTVVVRDGGLRMNVDVDEPVVGNQTDVTVNVSNGEPTAYRNIELVVDGTNVQADNPRRLTSLVGAGEDRSFHYSVTFPETGRSTIEAQLEYMTEEGQARSLRDTTTDEFRRTDAADGHPQVGVSVGEAVAGAKRPVNVTVANGLDETIRRMRVEVSSPAANFTVSERVQAELAARGTKTFTYPARVGTAGSYPVTVTVEYTDAEGKQRIARTVQTTFDEPTNPGKVILTDVEAVQRGGELEVSATASNVGSDQAEGVVVRIPKTDRAGSADYFVGSVEDSDFSSFTLSTGTSGNLSTVPLQVRYVVDGVERTAETEVPVTRIPTQQPTQSGGGFPLVYFGSALVLAGVGAVVYRKRR